MGSSPGASLLAQVWAVAGVAMLLSNAALRLGARGVHTMRGGMSPEEWLALAALTALFVYGEGVRALQRKYVPFILARAERLREERGLYRVLAPLYAMALVGRPVRSVVSAWAGVAAVAAAVLLVSRLPHPWRGIVDFAVAAALAWAVGALVAGGWRMLRRRNEVR